MPGASVATKNNILNHLCGNSTWTAPLARWAQLHVGDPGSAGTSNVAGNSVRKDTVDFNNASAGVVAMAAAILWLAVSTTEIYTHITLWDASTAGNFLISGTVTGGSVTAGGDFSLDTLTISITDP